MKREWAGVCVLWCVVYAETECESPAGQTNNMSLHPGPDHPPTTLNADELVATTTGQPQRPQGYLGSGVMWQECVCVFGWRGVTALDLKEKKKSGCGLGGDGGGGVQLHFLCRLKHAAATRSHSDVFLLIGTTSLCCCCFSPTHYFPLELVFLWTPLLGQMFCFQIIHSALRFIHRKNKTEHGNIKIKY